MVQFLWGLLSHGGPFFSRLPLIHRREEVILTLLRGFLHTHHTRSLPCQKFQLTSLLHRQNFSSVMRGHQYPCSSYRLFPGLWPWSCTSPILQHSGAPTWDSAWMSSELQGTEPCLQEIKEGRIACSGSHYGWDCESGLRRMLNFIIRRSRLLWQ